jgi:hypothetical protein
VPEIAGATVFTGGVGTTAVCADSAWVEPPALMPVTLNLIVEPTSELVTV